MRTHMHSIKGYAGALLLASLAACGGGGDFTSGGGGGTGGGGSSSNGSVSLGNGTGSSFQSGVLSISSTSVSAGGSTSITATVVDSSGTLYTQSSVNVSFNSPCISSGKATITGTGASGTTFTTTNGTVIATYTATGCSGADTVTATAAVNNSTLTATGTINVAAATLGSIQFVSATPSSITLKGMGGAGLQQTSTVIFTVKNSVGGVVSGANVTFSLVSSTGGVSLSTTKATSDANGQVQTIVQSGTHSGPVVVQAAVVVSGTTITTTSTGLAIKSGIPSQEHFSISVDTFNPEGYDIDNNTATITASLADRFANPVPDNTTVSFIESNLQYGLGGRVQGSCNTSNGTCSVVWSSQDPRPKNRLDNEHIGFAYILAFANGEESFNDTNGDGVFDKASGVTEVFSDVAEIFAPSAQFNASGTPSAYKSGEVFYDFNSNGSHDDADGLWEGVNCKAGTLCSTHKLTGVGKPVCIVMAASGASFTAPLDNGADASGQIQADGSLLLTVAGDSAGISISDTNGNVLPKGTTIKLDTANLVNGTATLSPSSSGTYTVGNTTCAGSVAGWPKAFTVTFTVTTPPMSGNVGVLVTSPGGTVSEFIIQLP